LRQTYMTMFIAINDTGEEGIWKLRISVGG